MYPRIEELRKSGRIVYVLDIDKFPAAASRCQVRAVPTTIVRDHSKEIARFIGVVDYDRVAEVSKTAADQKPTRPQYTLKQADPRPLKGIRERFARLIDEIDRRIDREVVVAWLKDNWVNVAKVLIALLSLAI